VFDKLARALNYGYRDFTGYYVTILAKQSVNRPFVPSDNEKRGRPEANEKIREIDGASFYEIATGSKTALADLYQYLPHVLASITGVSSVKIIRDPWFSALFAKAVK